MSDTKKSFKKEAASAPIEREPTEEAKSSDVKEKEKQPVVQKKLVPTPVPPLTARPVLVSFSRWFSARSREKGWKPHWVAGMKAYASTAGRLPMDGWDDLFRNY